MEATNSGPRDLTFVARGFKRLQNSESIPGDFAIEGTLVRGKGRLLLHSKPQKKRNSHLLASASAASVSRGEVNESRLRVMKIKGDGRCMFRAIAVGLAYNSGETLYSEDETNEADLLRLLVVNAICTKEKKRAQYPEAMYAIKTESDIQTYCRQLVQPTFWGGEPELLILSQTLQQPLNVYILQKDEESRNPFQMGSYRKVQQYGEQYARKFSTPPICLLYNGKTHYDLLVEV